MSLTIADGRTLSGELERCAASHPDRTWLIYETIDGAVTTYTYGQFRHRVNATARVLHELGLGAGHKILLHLGNCPEFLLLWFGAARIGAVIVPTNPLSSDPELEYLCGHSEAVLVAVAPDAVDRARRLRAACPAVRQVLVCGTGAGDGVALDQALASVSPEPPPHRPGTADEVAILYTSGTTSRPKGCLITNGNYVHVGEAVAQHTGLGPDDRHLVVLPYFHGNAQYYSTMSSLVVGGSLVVAERFSASRFFALAARHGATIGSLFAAPMRMLLAQPEAASPPPHRLRLVFFAQNLTPAQLDEWQRRFRVPLMQIYGMTEQLGHPLANPLHGPRDNMTIGRPTLAYRCRVVDADGHDVAGGEVGQLLVAGTAGVGLMKGYFKDPAATAAAIRDGWLWTGDNVRRRADGYFEFVDRAKDMIKRAGENVAASEVESVLKEHPAVFDVAVIGVPDPIRDEAIKAYVVARPGLTPTVDELIAWCAARLAKFRVPSLVELRAELPRTSVGKIQKHVLRVEHAAATREGAS
jgi:crotonobetaine/carnitine-CoA ligase